MYNFKRFPYLFYFLVSFHFLALGQSVNLHLNLDKDGLALSGYDVVEYYNHTAIKGKAAFESTHQGGKYHFSSLNNQLLFEKKPEKYLPQYGGWCAYAMAYSGEKVPINPESYSIENGKLYLFYKTFFNDTKVKWTENTAALKEKADKNWINLLKTSKNENKN